VRYHDVFQECVAVCAKVQTWESARQEIEQILDREPVYGTTRRDILDALHHYVWPRRQQELDRVYLGYQLI
jgi:hypothetical protein